MIVDWLWTFLNVPSWFNGLPHVPEDFGADSGVQELLMQFDRYIPIFAALDVVALFFSAVFIFFEIRLVLGVVGLIRGN